MTTLGIGSDPTMEVNLPSGKAKTQVVRHVAVVGGASTVVLVVLLALEIVKNNPKDAFPLLMAWGPKAVGTVLVIGFAYDIILRLIKAFTKVFRGAAGLYQRQVESSEKTSVALEKLATKDDRQTQEMQTLTAYTAQQSERTHDKIADLGTKFDVFASRFDQYLQEKKPS